MCLLGPVSARYGLDLTGVPAARPASGYTARRIPHRDDVAIPLEDAHILWQQ